MELLTKVLAQSSAESAPEKLHSFYQNWVCAGVIATLAVGLGTFLIVHLFKKRKSISEFDNNLVLAKEGVATIFMDTVVLEAQLLLRLIEEHLPDSITQALKSQPLRNKFDTFCERLIEINNDSNGNPRAGISGVFRREEIFSGLIVGEAKKLANIIKLSARLGQTDYNSTGISYALQGGTALKFNFIADRFFALEKVKKRYFFYLNSCERLAIFSLLGVVSLFVPLLWNVGFCGIWACVSIAIFVLLAFFSIVSFCLADKKSEQLINLRKEYESDSKTAYENWKNKK